MKHIYNIGFIGLGICIITSCSRTQTEIPNDIISIDTMSLLLKDAQIIEAATQKRLIDMKKTDVAGKSFFIKVLKHYSLDEEKFNESYEYYLDHPDRLALIYENALNELSKENAKLKVPEEQPPAKKLDKYHKWMSQQE